MTSRGETDSLSDGAEVTRRAWRVPDMRAADDQQGPGISMHKFDNLHYGKFCPCRFKPYWHGCGARLVQIGLTRFRPRSYPLWIGAYPATSLRHSPESD